MPEHPSYIHKLADILKEARSPKPIPFFRRRDIEALFGLQKRQATTLMHRLGAVRVSRELAVEQPDLVRWLEQRLSDPSAVAEWQRHERVIGRIVELKAETAARAIKIVLPEGVRSTEDLPEGVSFQAGLLAITFTTREQLLERLLLLARAFATKPHLIDNIPLPAQHPHPPET